MAKLRALNVKAASLPPGKAEKSFSDGNGLSLRLRSDGSKTWIYQYTSPTVPGSRPKITLGYYVEGGMSLDGARVKAAEYRKIVAAGQDPKIEAQQTELLSELGGKTPRTVRELFECWRADWLVSRHADQGAYVMGQLERHALPHLGDVELARLRAPHITATLAKISSGVASRTAGVVLGNLRQMLTHGVAQGWLQGDPSAAIKKYKWDESAPRERVLRENEIVLLPALFVSAHLSPAVQCALWISLSCLTRIEETCLARRIDLDLQAGVWKVPKENQKQTRRRRKLTDHYVDLSPFALRWFERLLALPQERAEQRNARLPQSKQLSSVPTVEIDLLFPDRTGKKPISRQTIEHALNDRQKPGVTPKFGRSPRVDSLVLPGGKWTYHDLRRTGSTLMRELGAAQDTIDRCLNHVESEVMVATYQLAVLRNEKLAAWLRLGERLEQLVGTATTTAQNSSQAATEEEDI